MSTRKKPLTKEQKLTELKERGKIPFMIGSDPEYLLFYGNRGLDAKEMITRYFENGRYTQSQAGYNITGAGDFGWDGASSTGELRPKATKNIFTHVNNIQLMLSAINNKIPFVDISTLSIGSPIGGHIHLDSFVHKNSNLFDGGLTREGNKILKRSNKLLATFLLPLVASDHRVSAMARLQGSYGKLNDIRYDQKGSAWTAEVRGLTAEWITTPQIAYATLAYLTTVWHEISKRHEELYKHPHMIRQQGHCDSVHKLLLSDYTLITDALTKELRKTVKTFELYPQFKKEIDFIMNPKKVYNLKANVGWNINQGWKFNDKLPKITKQSLLDDKIVQEILAKEDIPDIEKNFAVNYNDDYNVSSFARAISDRVATMNWALKNTYALYGFKKGITGLTASNEDEKFYSLSGGQEQSKTLATVLSMRQRFSQRRQYGAARINPKTGLTEGKNQGTIIIGLPYDIRAANNVSTMIELIYKIETGKLKAKNYTEFEIDTGVVEKNKKPDLSEVLNSSERQGRHNTLNDTIEEIINHEET